MRISLLKTNGNDFSKPPPFGSNTHYEPALSPKSSCHPMVAPAMTQAPAMSPLPHEKLFINIAITTKIVARALLNHQEQQVITNNLAIG